MKKQHTSANKLTFSKEKIAYLSSADLDQLRGGLADGGHGGSEHSTQHNFTCCLCGGGGGGGGGNTSVVEPEVD